MSLKSKVAAVSLTLSLSGILLIQQHEGTKLVAYPDPVGIPTICTGHTKGVYRGQKATPAECESFLFEDTTYAGAAVKRCTTAPVTQGQYDALVSLTFNIGPSAYCGSTLVRKLNQGDCRGAAEQFHRWVYAGRRKLPGLVTRRADESSLFIKDCE